jgi:hypothetical protein
MTFIESKDERGWQPPTTASLRLADKLSIDRYRMQSKPEEGAKSNTLYKHFIEAAQIVPLRFAFPLHDHRCEWLTHSR